MNKELTPLERLKNAERCWSSNYILIKEDYKIIETALKDYENLQLKHSSMQDAVLDDFKKLKALEIIKGLFTLRVYEKQGQYFICSGLAGESPITKEQASILKEVLL